MKFLLDASVVVPLLIDYGEKLLNIVAKVSFHVLDLTVYEAGNSLWKMSTLLKITSLEDAIEIIEVLKELTRKKLIKPIYFNELDLLGITELAARENTTFYDSSYIVASKKLNATLVTEDKELIKKAEKYVNVMTYAQLKQYLYSLK
ncbi:MAG: hypothetical protein DRJ52_05800 [Thermoprotei archaeon]|nr:MAG: hypothetical protein DRJ52_05800 [Thermoprotei archaeon]